MENKDKPTHDEVIEKAGVDHIVKELKEELELPPEDDTPFVPDTEPDKESNVDDLFGDADEPTLGDSETDDSENVTFDFNNGHLDSARFILIQMDKIVSFVLYLFSGVEQWDKYRIRKDGSPHGTDEEDYELMALASILKKYHLNLSIEFVFITAMAMAYTGASTQAFKDRKERLSKKEENKKSDKE